MIIRRVLFVLATLAFSVESSAETWPRADFDSLVETKQYELLSLALRDHELVCDAKLADRLMVLATHRSYRIREASVDLLDSCRGASNAQSIGEFLRGMIDDDNERSQVRSSVILTIGGMGEITPQIRDTLKDYAINSNGSIRRENAMHSWAAYGVADDELLALIYQRFTAQRKSTRVVAARCLLLLAGDLNSKPKELTTALNSIESNLPSGHLNFDLALVALVEALQPASERLIPTLMVAMQEQPFVRKDVAVMLPQFGAAAKAALPILRELADKTKVFEYKTITKAIRQIESF